MAWWKTAKPGEPVVCVEKCRCEPVLTFPGKVYVIRDIKVVDQRYSDEGTVGLYLKGIFAGYTCYGEETGFYAERFRPAQTSDLPASLTECLNTPVKTEERV